MEIEWFIQPVHIYLSKLGRKILLNERVFWSHKQWINVVKEFTDVFIIVSAWEGAEIFDRLSAYKILENIHIKGLCGLVLTDIRWRHVSERYGYSSKPFIAVGGPRVNSVARNIAKKLGIKETSSAVGFTKINGIPVGYVWGRDARKTLLLTDTFISKYLNKFIEEILKRK